MENTRQFNPDLWNRCMEEGIPDREIPSGLRLPGQTNGDQTTAVALRANPLMAQDLLPGLERRSSEDLCLRRQGRLSSLA